MGFKDFDKLSDLDKFVDPKKRAKSLKELKVKLEFQRASYEPQIKTDRHITNYTRYAWWTLSFVAITTIVLVIYSCGVD